MIRSILAFSLLFMDVGLGLPAVPVIQTVLNGASLEPSLAPGTLAIIQGTNLSPGPASADGLPLSIELSGVSIDIFGTAAPILSVSETQISFVIPFEIDLGGAVKASMPLTVRTPGGTSLPFTITLERSAPGILTQDGSPAGAALVFDADLNPLSQIGGDTIVLQATGLGPTDPPGSSAMGGSADEPYNRLVDEIAVFIGDNPGVIQSVRLAPGMPGVYEIRVLPQGPISNRVFIETQMHQKRSNIATLPIPVGTNVANVRGSIDGVYPPSGPSACDSDPSGLACLGNGIFGLFVPYLLLFDISEMPFAGSFAVTFDIQPGAGPFQVIARCNGVSQVIQIDPASAGWRGIASSATAAARVYDFSRLSHPVIDFVTHLPFPGNIVPAARVSLMAAKVMAYFPLPNSDVPDGDNATLESIGVLQDPSHVEWRGLQNFPLTYFGGFTSITEPPGDASIKLSTTRFELFVDGLLVATKEIPFAVL